MKKELLITLIGLSSVYAQAHEGSARADSHAPAGVMADHMHKAGEVMVGYRYEYAFQSGLRKGEEDISASDMMHSGYRMLADDMSMKMQMLDIMYAPTDNLTLMLMPMYMEMDMTMAPNGHDMMGMQHHNKHAHGVEGWGDTQLGALVSLFDDGFHKLHVYQGVSMPTGDIDLLNRKGVLTHYGMQLGSGTYDYIANLTYYTLINKWNWGVQLSGTYRMQDENDNGYRLGHKAKATSWLSYLVNPSVSINTRIEVTTQGEIEGEYNAPHADSSPGDKPYNYGRDLTQWGFGVNYMVPSTTGKKWYDPLSGIRISAEYLIPLNEKVNGVQLASEDSFKLVISKSW